MPQDRPRKPRTPKADRSPASPARGPVDAQDPKPVAAPPAMAPAVAPRRAAHPGETREVATRRAVETLAVYWDNVQVFVNSYDPTRGHTVMKDVSVGNRLANYAQVGMWMDDHEDPDDEDDIDEPCGPGCPCGEGD